MKREKMKHQDYCGALKLCIEENAVVVNVFDPSQVFIRGPKPARKSPELIRIDFCPWCGNRLTPEVEMNK